MWQRPIESATFWLVLLSLTCEILQMVQNCEILVTKPSLAFRNAVVICLLKRSKSCVEVSLFCILYLHINWLQHINKKLMHLHICGGLNYHVSLHCKCWTSSCSENINLDRGPFCVSEVAMHIECHPARANLVTPYEGVGRCTITIATTLT